MTKDYGPKTLWYFMHTVSRSSEGGWTSYVQPCGSFPGETSSIEVTVKVGGLACCYEVAHLDQEEMDRSKQAFGRDSTRTRVPLTPFAIIWDL